MDPRIRIRIHTKLSWIRNIEKILINIPGNVLWVPGYTPPLVCPAVDLKQKQGYTLTDIQDAVAKKEKLKSIK
jgi:hypothetical protein